MATKPHYPRAPRYPFEGEVLVKRRGKPTLKAYTGNVSEGGLFINLSEHDLQKGRRVDLIFVTQKGTVRSMERMTGVVIRIDPEGVAMVTYNASALKRPNQSQPSVGTAQL